MSDFQSFKNKFIEIDKNYVPYDDWLKEDVQSRMLKKGYKNAKECFENEYSPFYIKVPTPLHDKSEAFKPFYDCSIEEIKKLGSGKL